MTTDTRVIREDVAERLGRLEKSGRLGHAYLFSGAEGTGKFATALEVAKGINCESASGRPCGKCFNCVNMESAQHPDVQIIECPPGEQIKIIQVRDLLAQSHLSPFSAKRKIFIIRNVERLGLAAANALLKTLEEPSASSLILLTASCLERVLETIRSRCQVIFFPSQSGKNLIKEVVGRFGCEPAQAQCLANFTEGNLGQVPSLIEADFMNEKNTCLDAFLYEPDMETYLKQLLSDRIKAKDMIGALLCWVRDAMLLSSGAEEHRLVHADRIEELQAYCRKKSWRDLNDILSHLVKASQLLGENLNVKMTLLIIKARIA